jgi:hypothetical protein
MKKPLFAKHFSSLEGNPSKGGIELSSCAAFFYHQTTDFFSYLHGGRRREAGQKAVVDS